jgi:hypothetical protein
VATRTSCRALISRTEGSESPAASIPDLAHLQVAERRLDNPSDVSLIRLPRRQVPVGYLGVLVHELGHGRVCLRLASRGRLLEQLAELDQRRPFGLAGLPQADLAARQRIGPSVDLHPSRTAGELLYVTGQLLTHDITITRTTDTRSTSRSTRTMINMVFYQVRSSRLGLTWGNGVWPMGCPQVKRAPPTRSGVCCSGSAGRRDLPASGRASGSSGGRLRRWRG